MYNLLFVIDQLVVYLAFIDSSINPQSIQLYKTDEKSLKLKTLIFRIND